MNKFCTISILVLILTILFPITLDAKHFARWETSMGSFTAELYEEIVPITANNFINLTNSGFYDGLQFHRVVEGFVIQDGDPLGNGYGGPGYTIEDEFSPLLHHDQPGILAMANTGQPHSAGSQYYITLAAYPSLDGHYAIFGKVIAGMDTVFAISHVPVNTNNHPLTPVYINNLDILGLVINAISPADSIVTYNASNQIPFIVEAYDVDHEVQFHWYVDGTLIPEATDFIFIPSIYQQGIHRITCITSTVQISYSTSWQVDVIVSNSEEVITPDNNINLKIYPNPLTSSSKLHFNLVESLPTSISIFDIKGRLLSCVQVDKPKTGLNELDWKDLLHNNNLLPSGIYIIKVRFGAKSYFTKCVNIK